MLDIQSFMDRIHYSGERAYTHVEGNVAYLDGNQLARPNKLPRSQMVIAAVIVAVGAIIGIVILNNTVISSLRESVTAEQAITDNLAREGSIDTIPLMADLVNLDDDAIRNSFAEAGYTMFDASEMYDANNMTLYKIPSDMTLADVAVLYAKGINSLSAAEATRLLNGSWYFATDRVNTTSMIVRYADFSTGDPQVAVQNALIKEGFDAESIAESGVDESGNTYSTGMLDAAGTPCTWKVSALPLADMYSTAGLPENACYVGIRLTVQ